jgi:uncharacterized protein YndB with AHSA1/START domain
MSTHTLTFEQNVKAQAEAVYQAFTNATTLREFLAQVATVNPKAGGRIYLAWDNGYYTAGEYTRLEDNQAVAFTWQGRADPGATWVEISLAPSETGTRINLAHNGLGEGPEWQAVEAEWQKGWKDGLENLASILETGEDLRLTRRPMMGILYGEFNPEIAGKMGVPVSEGVRLGGVVEGLSAKSAGLQKDDVLVEMGGEKIKEWNDLGPVLQRRRSGEQVELVFYRGGEQQRVNMTLAKRPLPEIPWTAEALAARISQRNQETIEQLEQLLRAVSEAEASFKPAPDEWSIKQVLAHLLQGERFFQSYLLELVGGQERWSDDYGGNEEVMIQGTLAIYPSLKELLAEIKRALQATTVMAGALPNEFLEKRKGSYWRVAYNCLQPDYHLQDHLQQMQACLEAARSNR